MSFKAERLVRMTIKGKEDFYTESEVEELRDVLLSICPLTESKTTPTITVKADNPPWVLNGHLYKSGRRGVSKEYVDKVFNLLNDAPEKRFTIMDIRSQFSSSNALVSFIFEVLQQQNKIEGIREKGVTYFKIKKINYTPSRQAIPPEVCSNPTDLSALRIANMKNIQAMREN